MNKEYIITEKSNLTNIAEAIRNKTKTTNGILLMDFPTLIENLGGGREQWLVRIPRSNIFLQWKYNFRKRI